MDDDVILNAWQWGSRLFNNHESDSDYDLITVIRGFHGPIKGKENESPEQLHFQNVIEGNSYSSFLILQGTFKINTRLSNGQTTTTIVNVDTAVYEENFWQNLINDHIIWVLPFQFLPKLEPSLHQIVRYKDSKQFPFELRLLKLKSEVINDQSKNLDYAKRYWTKNNQYRRSKKRVVCCNF